MQVTERQSVAVIGAKIFSLSLAVTLRGRKYEVTLFGRNPYDQNGYDPDAQAASMDLNKIVSMRNHSQPYNSSTFSLSILVL
ncbi:hypothetical protein BDV12DRAFT_197747 [Aspergillus spectabilis]